MPWLEHVKISKDVLEAEAGIFQVDFSEVVSGKAKEIYKNPEIFFKKTYFTNSLKNILENVLTALFSSSASTKIVNLITAFGGGKTHTLLTLYHTVTSPEIALKFKEIEEIVTRNKLSVKKSNVVIIVGTSLSEHQTLWYEIAKQLDLLNEKIKLPDGRELTIKDFSSSPGKEVLKQLLSKKTPLLILVDELLAYLTKLKNNKNLLENTLVFLQELTEIVSEYPNMAMVITIPKSGGKYEIYDEELAIRTSRVIQRIQPLTLEPISESEVHFVVRKRLFDEVDEAFAKQVVEKLSKIYDQLAEKEYLLKSFSTSSYKRKMLESFPIHPQVIDVLYNRWNLLQNFQRTRHVLTFLSLVVRNLSEHNDKNDILLCGDVDLKDTKIKSLIKQFLNEEKWESVIKEDIIDHVKEINTITKTKINYPKRLSIAIFMFTAPTVPLREEIKEKGVTLKEILPSVLSTTIESSSPHSEVLLVKEVLEKMKEKMFYLYAKDSSFRFDIIPNINKVILELAGKFDEYSIEKLVIEDVTRSLGRKNVFWEPQNVEVPDNKELKFVIIRSNGKRINEIIEYVGDVPREFKNTIVFLEVDERILSELKDLRSKLEAVWRIRKDHEWVKSIRETGQEKSLDEKERQLKLTYEFKLSKAFKLLVNGKKVQIERLSRKSITEILEKYGKYTYEISPEAVLMIYENKFQKRDVNVQTFVDFFYKSIDNEIPFVENEKSIILALRKLVLDRKLGLKDPTGRVYRMDEIGMLKEEVLRESILTVELPISEVKEEKIEEIEKMEEVPTEVKEKFEEIGNFFRAFKEKNVNFIKDVIEPFRHFGKFIKLKGIKMDIEFEGDPKEKENFVEFLKRKGYRVLRL